MQNPDLSLAKRILPLIDLTNLDETASENQIVNLCQQAITPQGAVAAICIYPKFIVLAKRLLANTPVKIATVCNFPTGDSAITVVTEEIKKSIEAGADEIDVVMPYHDYLEGKITAVSDFIMQCKKTCGETIILKVILETGALQQPAIIANASRDVILAGADFIKTSTGKITIGATLPAAEAMLQTIHDLHLNRTVGFKASGGIRTLADAEKYLQLADKIMRPDWVSAKTFRFGASNLLSEIRKIFEN